MTDITWEDPPPPRRRGPTSRYPKLADLLRKRPGQWALINETQDRSGQTYAKQQLGPGFEVTGRFDAETQTHKIYARFIREVK
jgi:hypothetical protein